MKENVKIYSIDLKEETKSVIVDFFKQLDIEVEYVDSLSDAVISIDCPEEREESEASFLHFGGRISCPAAFTAAQILGINRNEFGKLTNLLNIKIHGCQLGCFK